MNQETTSPHQRPIKAQHYKPIMDQGEVVPRLVYLILVVVATIFGNLLVIVAVAKFKTLRRSTNLMLASLAVADLMVGFITVPLYILWTLNPAIFDTSSFLCRLVLLSCLLFVAASQVSLLLLSVERYLAVCQPFKHRALILHCPWVHKAAICFIWTTSIITTAASSTAIRSDYTTCNYYGAFDKMFLFFTVLFGIFVLFLAIIVINIKVFCSVRAHELKLSFLGLSGNIEQRSFSDFSHQDAITSPAERHPKTVENMVWSYVFAADAKLVLETRDLPTPDSNGIAELPMQVSSSTNNIDICSDIINEKNKRSYFETFLNEDISNEIQSETNKKSQKTISCLRNKYNLIPTDYDEKDNILEMLKKEYSSENAGNRTSDKVGSVCFNDSPRHTWDREPMAADDSGNEKTPSSKTCTSSHSHIHKQNDISTTAELATISRHSSNLNEEKCDLTKDVISEREINGKPLSVVVSNQRKYRLPTGLCFSNAYESSQNQPHWTEWFLDNSQPVSYASSVPQAFIFNTQDNDQADNDREDNDQEDNGREDNDREDNDHDLTQKEIQEPMCSSSDKNVTLDLESPIPRTKPVRNVSRCRISTVSNNSRSSWGKSIRKLSGVSSQTYIRTKVARTVTLVCASFILAWLPFFVVIIYNTFCNHCDLDYALNAVLIVAFGQSASNPVIYALCHASFRRAYVSLLNQLCSKTSLRDNVMR